MRVIRILYLSVFFALGGILAINAQGKLSVTVTVTPTVPSIYNKLYFSAVASNGEGDIKWSWTINKNPDDFGDYPNDPSKRDVYQMTTRAGSEYTSNVNGISRNKKGKYKVTLHALDVKTSKQFLETLYVEVVESQAGILAGNVGFADCLKDLEPYPTFEINTCVTVWGNATLFPLWSASADYDGIGEVNFKVMRNGSNIRSNKTETYNTTMDLANNTYNKFYQHEQIYTETYKTEGEYSATLSAWGGKFKWGSATGGNPQPSNPLAKVSMAGGRAGFTATLRFRVVDSSKKLTITDINNYNKTEKYGYITVDGSKTVIESGSHTLDAYHQIVLKPGFRVKQGASFVATISETPISNNCSCGKSLTKGKQENYDDTTEIGRSEVITSDFNLFPNPTTGIINIVFSSDYFAELYNLEGKKVGEFNSMSEIDISHLPMGIYILRAYYDDKSEVHKVVLNK